MVQIVMPSSSYSFSAMATATAKTTTTATTNTAPLIRRRKAYGSSNNNYSSNTNNKRRRRSMPPWEAVLLAAVILVGSCFLTYRNKQHRSLNHKNNNININHNIDSSALDSQALHHHHDDAYDGDLHHRHPSFPQPQLPPHRLMASSSSSSSSRRRTKEDSTTSSSSSTSALPLSPPTLLSPSLSLLLDADDWCQSLECQGRLVELKSKLALEEKIYQEQLVHERRRTRREGENQHHNNHRNHNNNNHHNPYTREFIFQQEQQDMQDNLEESHQENPNAFIDIIGDGDGGVDSDGGDGTTNTLLDYYKELLAPKPEWIAQGSFPDINVVGNLKTGTSHLYNLFATHRDVVHPKEYNTTSTIAASHDDGEEEQQQGDWKEHCAHHHFDGEPSSPKDTYLYAMQQWHQFYFEHKVPGKLQVNGCIGLDDLKTRIVYNPPPPTSSTTTTKFFVLLRDPADWAWAAYNFWTDPAWEEYDEDNNWIGNNEEEEEDEQDGGAKKVHYRSPEAFHEAILSGDKLLATEIYDELKTTSIETLRVLEALVGKENLIVLKNEDLRPDRIHTSGLLRRIADATGLSIDGFDEKVLHSRSNCNANKGFGTLCTDNEEREQPYRKDNKNKIKEDTTNNHQQEGVMRGKLAKKEKALAARLTVSSNNDNDKKAETTTTTSRLRLRLLEKIGDSAVNTASRDGTITAAELKEHPHSHSRTVGYPVTHYRPMLESTRKFIYLQWHMECKIWAEEFGVEYPECLDAIPGV